MVTMKSLVLCFWLSLASACQELTVGRSTKDLLRLSLPPSEQDGTQVTNQQILFTAGRRFQIESIDPDYGFNVTNLCFKTKHAGFFEVDYSVQQPECMCGAEVCPCPPPPPAGLLGPLAYDPNDPGATLETCLPQTDLIYFDKLGFIGIGITAIDEINHPEMSFGELTMKVCMVNVNE